MKRALVLLSCLALAGSVGFTAGQATGPDSADAGPSVRSVSKQIRKAREELRSLRFQVASVKTDTAQLKNQAGELNTDHDGLGRAIYQACAATAERISQCPIGAP